MQGDTIAIKSPSFGIVAVPENLLAFFNESQCCFRRLSDGDMQETIS